MAPRYGEFTFDSCCGFTGSAGKKPVKGYMRGGYAEGGMRSERTEEAKATRRVQDDAFAPARQLNKSLKNLNRVRKETGYGLYDEEQNYAKGGRKMPTQDDRQQMMPGFSAPTQKEKLDLEANKPMRGKVPQKDPNDLFQPLAPDMLDLMKKRGGSVKYAKGGKFGMRKTRSDKGKTQEVPPPKFGPGAGGPSMPGRIGPADTPMIQSPTSVAAPTIGNAMKMGGRAKRR